jgi:putative spermidine/putrescine transport system substrate-binding protein
MRKASRWLIVCSVLAVVAAACGEDAAEPSGDGEPPVVYDEIGEGEGQLNLIAWHGYTEDGTTEGYEEYDWVTPFEDETGCDVTVTYGDSSDEMVQLMRSGGGSEYDGVSASGDASNRLIAGGDVGAVDPSLFPEMENVIAPINPDGGTKTSHYIVGDDVYGTPYMYGPNFLMYNADEVSPAPTSWDVTFESDSAYAGKVTAYGSPIFIADAAMYLMTHQPDLGITDPYELTQEQFDATVELLKQQNELISSYWTLYTEEIDGFLDGSMVVGTAWPVNFTYTKGPEAANTRAVIPSEGATGWADTWMISANAPNPNCMLKWMDWTLQPEVQAEVGIYYGAAGSNVNSCAELATQLGEGGEELVNTLEYGFCGDADFLTSLHLWKTPAVSCGDDRGDVCVDYSQWTQAWTEITGS